MVQNILTFFAHCELLLFIHYSLIRSDEVSILLFMYEIKEPKKESLKLRDVMYFLCCMPCSPCLCMRINHLAVEYVVVLRKLVSYCESTCELRLTNMGRE